MQLFLYYSIGLLKNIVSLHTIIVLISLTFLFWLGFSGLSSISVQQMLHWLFLFYFSWNTIYFNKLLFSFKVLLWFKIILIFLYLMQNV